MGQADWRDLNQGARVPPKEKIMRQLCRNPRTLSKREWTRKVLRRVRIVTDPKKLAQLRAEASGEDNLSGWTSPSEARLGQGVVT